jgi:maltose O-acetyltransferase
MNRTEIINKILFEYESLSHSDIIELCSNLPKKILRWLGAHHPDNKTRKIFFELTNVQIGKDTVINQNFIVSDGYHPLLKIGDRVAISPNVTIVCESAPNNSDIAKIPYVSKNLICNKGVTIEDDVWIGANAVIMPGVKVGNSAVIGAGAIVTKDVKPFSVVAGVPAKQIRSLKDK